MKWRWILLLALMLSVGVNLGTLIALWRQAPAPSVAAASPEDAAKPSPVSPRVASPSESAPLPAAPQPAAPQPAAPQPAAPLPAAPQPAAAKRKPAAAVAPAPAASGPSKPQPGPAQTAASEPPRASPPNPEPALGPDRTAAPGEEARPEEGSPPTQGGVAPPGSGPRGVELTPPSGPGESPPRPPAPRFDRLAAELGLTPDQRARFFTSQRRHVEAARAVQLRLRASRVEMATLLTAGAADRAAIERLLREQAELQAALDGELASMLVEARGILTPEQYRRYARVVLTRPMPPGPAAGGLRPEQPPRRPGARRPRRFN